MMQELAKSYEDEIIRDITNKRELRNTALTELCKEDMLLRDINENRPIAFQYTVSLEEYMTNTKFETLKRFRGLREIHKKKWENYWKQENEKREQENEKREQEIHRTFQEKIEKKYMNNFHTDEQLIDDQLIGYLPYIQAKHI
jgi:hypothetical protein